MNGVERGNRWLAYGIFLFSLVLSLIMYGSFEGEYHLYRLGDKCDGADYITMAQAPFTPVQNPFGLRVLTPLLVRAVRDVSGGRLGWDFCWYTVTFAALFLSVVVFYHFLRDHLRLGGAVAVLGGLFLLNTHVYTQFHFYDPFRVDQVSNLFWMLALVSLFRDRYGLFCCLVLVGAMCKEVMLFLLPLYPLFVLLREGKPTTRRVLQSLAASALVLGLYLLFRLPLAHNLKGQDYPMFSAYGQSWIGTLADAIEHQKDVYAIYFVFAFLWIFFALCLYELCRRGGLRNRYVAASLYLLAALLFGRLFARDANRVFAMMAPLVISLGLTWFVSVWPRDASAVRWLVGLLFVYAAMSLGWVPEKNWQILLNAAVLFAVFTKAGNFEPARVNPALEGELSRL